MARTGFLILGGLLSFVGTIWILQGINVLPGSFMTGQMRWAVIGGFTLLGGVLVLAATWRRR
jgi:hypothetical protein